MAFPFAPTPHMLTCFARHHIEDDSDLRLVLADARACALLETDLGAAPLAKVRASLGLNQPSGEPLRVEAVNPETMSTYDLIARIIARPEDLHAREVGRRRIPRVAIAPNGKLSAEGTNLLVAGMTNVPPYLWPATYQRWTVSTWEEAFPAARPLWCPLTGEPVVEGRTTRSGLEWNVPEEARRFLAFLATQTEWRRHHTDRDILADAAAGRMSGPEYAGMRRAYQALAESERVAFGESLYQEPRANPPRGSGDGGRVFSSSSLRRVLLAGFSGEEAARLARSTVPGVADILPGRGAAPADVADAIAEYCCHAGFTETLANAAIRDRPRRAIEFRAILGIS